MAALSIILLHAPDGGEIGVNPGAIVSLRPPSRSAAAKLLPRSAHCLIGLSDGKAAAVIETCASVRALVEAPS
jgi:hypothetical protein